MITLPEAAARSGLSLTEVLELGISDWIPMLIDVPGVGLRRISDLVLSHLMAGEPVSAPDTPKGPYLFNAEQVGILEDDWAKYEKGQEAIMRAFQGRSLNP